MIDYNRIIDRYYSEFSAAYEILMTHSRQVASLALSLAKRYEAVHGAVIDMDFLTEASMLHDIGVICCDAPGICCYGTEPYIKHGILGGEMLDREGLPRHAEVCRKHTGAGITAAEVISQQLPLPHCDYVPQSIEERLICYADKFFSKSHIDRTTPKDLEAVRRSLSKFGGGTLERFEAMVAEFGRVDEEARFDLVKN